MRKWIPALLIAGAYALSIAAYGQIPPTVAPDLSGLLPFDLGASPDAGPRAALAFALPTVALALWLLMHEAPARWLGRATGRRVAPGTPATTGDDFWKYAPTYRLIVAWVVALVLSIHVAFLSGALGWGVPPGLVVGATFGVGVLMVGTAMPSLRPKPVAGIRTRR